VTYFDTFNPSFSEIGPLAFSGVCMFSMFIVSFGAVPTCRVNKSTSAGVLVPPSESQLWFSGSLLILKFSDLTNEFGILIVFLIYFIFFL